MQTLDYHDPEWVSEQLGLERNTVYKYLKEGILPAVRIGKKWLISESKLTEWLEQETEKQTRTRREATGSVVNTIRRMDNYTVEAREILKSAHTIARNCGHDFLGQEHFVQAMIEDPKCLAGEKILEVVKDIGQIENLLNERCPVTEKEVPRRLGRSEDAKTAMRLAAEKAKEEDAAQINSEHLLAGILAAKKGKGYEILVQAGVSLETR